MRRENSGVIGSGSSSTVSKVELEGNLKALSDKRVVEACKAIDIFNHTRRVMENLKEVSKLLLGPAADLVNRAVVLENIFDGTTVAEPKEFGAPYKGRRSFHQICLSLVARDL